jgi:ribosomal protein S19E (S16A)
MGRRSRRRKRSDRPSHLPTRVARVADKVLERLEQAGVPEHDDLVSPVAGSAAVMQMLEAGGFDY